MIVEVENRTTALVLLAFSLVCTGIGYYLLKIYQCPATVYCYYFQIKVYAVYYFAPALALVFLFLAIFPKALRTWWRFFAIWYLPISFLFFIFYTGPASGDLFSPWPQTLFTWLSEIYVGISVLLILGYALFNKGN